MRRSMTAVLLVFVVGALVGVTPSAYADRFLSQAVFIQAGETVFVTADMLNVREGPGTSFRVLDLVNRGASLSVLARNAAGDWLQVRTLRSVLGWVSARYVTSGQAASSVASIQAPPNTGSGSQRANDGGCNVSPFVPNTSVASDANIVECFGAGTTPLRRVGANTPVQVLGIGDYGPQGEELEKLGPGPYAKIRLWDGQFAWIAISHLRVEANSVPRTSSICEACDQIDWSSVVRPTPVPIPSRYQSTDSGNSRAGCCKVCTRGKACGDTCINANYTCHVGPGCACNG